LKRGTGAKEHTFGDIKGEEAPFLLRGELEVVFRWLHAICLLRIVPEAQRLLFLGHQLLLCHKKHRKWCKAKKRKEKEEVHADQGTDS